MQDPPAVRRLIAESDRYLADFKGPGNRDHRHKAPELHVPLTGPHEWRFGTGESWSEYAAHIPIWNESMRTHATLVRDTPFLAHFACTKDVKAGSAIVAAPDWAEIEARL